MVVPEKQFTQQQQHCLSQWNSILSKAVLALSWDCRVHVLTAEQVRSKTNSQMATWATPKVVLFCFFLFVLQSIGVNILRQIKYALSSRPTWVRNHPYLEGPMKWLIESNWWDAVRSSLLLSTVKWRKLDSRLIEMWKDRWSLVWKKGIRKREKWGSERVKGKRKKKRRWQRGWEGKRTKKEPIILREIPLECLQQHNQGNW